MLLETRVIELAKDNHILKCQLNAVFEKYGIKGENLVTMEHFPEMAAIEVKVQENLSVQQHVMLSYNWDYQSTIKRIHASLTFKHGYTVWIDIEKMQGVADFFVNLHYFGPKSSFLTPISMKISRNFVGKTTEASPRLPRRSPVRRAGDAAYRALF